MSHIFGCYEPFGSLKNAFFHGLLAQYFVTFFIEHPVGAGEIVIQAN